MLEGNLPNSQLENDSITINGTEVALGGSTTIATGGTNTPAFEAYQSANTNISDATNVKVECDTEVFDTDNCYDNSTNFRFTPTVAGKYFFYGAAQGYGGQLSGIETLDAKIFKNGSQVRSFSHNYSNSFTYVQHSNFHITIDMNGTSDYVEFYVNFNAVGTPRLNGSSTGDHCYWGAYRLVGA